MARLPPGIIAANLQTDSPTAAETRGELREIVDAVEDQLLRADFDVNINSDALAQLGGNLAASMGRAGMKSMEAAADVVLESAARRAPRDTGALARSGRKEKVGPGWWRITFGEGLPDARAIVQEVGFMHANGQFIRNPYLRPAMAMVLRRYMSGALAGHFRDAYRIK